MQTDKSTFDKVFYGHRFPAVVISITDDKAGEDEEEIHRQVSVVDLLIYMTTRIGFKNVKP